MKKIVKTLLIIITLGSMISCKSTFNASKTMGIQGNRSAVYQEIISNPNQFKEYANDGIWKHEKNDGERSRNETKDENTYGENDGGKF